MGQGKEAFSYLDHTEYGQKLLIVILMILIIVLVIVGSIAYSNQKKQVSALSTKLEERDKAFRAFKDITNEFTIKHEIQRSFSSDEEHLNAIRIVREKYEKKLFRIPGVYLVRVMKCDGTYCISADMDKGKMEFRSYVPEEIEGYKVVVTEGEMFRAY